MGENQSIISNNTFQLRFIQIINKLNKGNNILISPFSLFYILKIISSYSKGNIKNEIEKILSIGINQNDFDSIESYFDLMKSFYGITFSNAIFTRKKSFDSFISFCQKKNIFTDILSNLNQINDWFSKIKKEPKFKLMNQLEGDFNILLINYLFYCNEWKEVFNITKKIFKKSNGKEEYVYFISNFFKDIPYLNSSTSQVIKLNFSEDELCAYIILPNNKYTINDFINNITSEEIINIFNSLSNKNVHLLLPKFKIEGYINGKDILSSLEINLYPNQYSKYSYMFKKGSYTNFIQKISLNLNEEGINCKNNKSKNYDLNKNKENISNYEIMECNRPFLFIITPNKENIPKDFFLFTSIINEISTLQYNQKEYENNLNIIKKKHKLDKIKVVLLGDKEVGKTKLLERTINNEFNDKYNPTFEANDSLIDLDKYKFDIWDTSGDESYRYVNCVTCKNMDIAIFVFNLSKKDSLEKLKNIFSEYKNKSLLNECVIGIIGCKSGKNMENKDFDGVDFANSIQAEYMELSPELGDNLKEILVKLAEKLNKDY